MPAKSSEFDGRRRQALCRALKAADSSLLSAAAAADPELARRLLSRRRRRWEAALALAEPPQTRARRPAGPVAGEGFAVVPVLERVAVTADLTWLRLARPAGFVFQPGQYAKLQLGGERRSYSLASAPGQEVLEFFIEHRPGGLSERLGRLVPGDHVGISRQPKGRFAFDPERLRQLMLATVTGVSPFLSMLRQLDADGRLDHYRIELIHGASYQDEFAVAEELRALEQAHPRTFRYLPSVSRPREPRNAGWAGSTGRLDTVLAEVLRREPAEPATTTVYACGHPAMVDAAAAVAAAAGLDLRTERY